MNRAALLDGSISRTIISLTLPMSVGMIGMVAFNLVDAYFIGKLGTQYLAAAGFTLPVVMVQGAISMGLGVGASAIISRAIGQGDDQRVRRLTVDSLALSVALVIVLSIAGLLTIDPLFSLIGARGEMLALVRSYMSVWYLGLPCVVIPMVGNNAIRAAGNTVIPSAIMLIAIVVNVIFDPLLIFGIGPFPRLELRGAALATVLARATTMAASLLFLHFRFGMLTRVLPSRAQLAASWRQALHIGAPAALTQALIPVSIAAITRLIAGYGETAVAAFAVSSRIELFLLSPLMALGAVLVPFVGQNAGAGRQDRVRAGVWFGYRFSLILGGALFVLIWLCGRPLAALFDPSPAVATLVYRYLLIVSLSYGFQGVTALSASFFNASKMPLSALMVTLLRAILLYVPLAWIGARFWALTGIFAGAAAASVIAGIAGIAWVRGVLARAQERAEA
jgi:putative MATE family efflux protein